MSAVSGLWLCPSLSCLLHQEAISLQGLCFRSSIIIILVTQTASNSFLGKKYSHYFVIVGIIDYSVLRSLVQCLFCLQVCDTEIVIDTKMARNLLKNPSGEGNDT